MESRMYKPTWQMRSNLALCFILILLVNLACKDTEEPVMKIDVSDQWLFDYNGQINSIGGQEQWKNTILTSQELTLFESLDTMDLTGTTAPDSVKENITYPYPNPFYNIHAFAFGFNAGYTGQLVFKYVVVDSLFNPLDKIAVRFQADSNYNNVHIMPDIPEGRYRLYYTLSSQSEPHFFQCWGNIEQTQ